tara:strand:- start:732 stop:953 length:222 start_codon:yes stop_codon:yes gene_type:complete
MDLLWNAYNSTYYMGVKMGYNRERQKYNNAKYKFKYEELKHELRNEESFFNRLEIQKIQRRRTERLINKNKNR